MTLFSGEHPPTTRRRTAIGLAVGLILALLPFQAATASTTATITVATAISTQNGSTATVQGYVVGQPTSTTTVVTSNYPNDYALALADTAGESSTSKMLYVQIPDDFGTTPGPGTDIHHLRPEDVTVNSTRGNKDFDNGGTAVSEAPGSYTDSDSFEPRNAVKGDVARMILYMAVRWDGGDGYADLEPNDSVNDGTAPYIGKLSVLKAWSAQDPPDAFEQRRNQVIFDKYQHNRNPFVDHPEWVSAIWN